MDSKLLTTASASNGAPLWKVTPLRRKNRHVRGLGDSQRWARPASAPKVSLIRLRVSKIWGFGPLTRVPMSRTAGFPAMNGSSPTATRTSWALERGSGAVSSAEVSVLPPPREHPAATRMVSRTRTTIERRRDTAGHPSGYPALSAGGRRRSGFPSAHAGGRALLGRRGRTRPGPPPGRDRRAQQHQADEQEPHHGGQGDLRRTRRPPTERGELLHRGVHVLHA